MDKKKILIGCFALIILASIGASIYIVSKDEKKESEFQIDGMDLPENKEILQDSTVGDLKVTDVSIIFRDDMSNFKALVTNDTAKDIYVDKLYVVFYEGNQESRTMLLYDITIPSSTGTHVDITSEKDLTKVTKIEYVLE